MAKGAFLCTGVAVLHVVLFLQFQVTSVAAWGAAGHHITCLIAEPLLDPRAARAVQKLLPEHANGSLASMCAWPDEVKRQSKYRWSKEMHYVDTPDFLCRYNYGRDCHDSHAHQDMCVSGAINNFTSQLASSHNDFQQEHRVEEPPSQHNLTEALFFLAHFVGDIHQPLHTGFVSDEGGNTIIVHWYTRKYNLHHVWDNEFINRATSQFYDSDITVMAQSLLNNITGNWAPEADKWAQCDNEEIACPDKYAAESISIACKFAYKGATPGTTLTDEYFLSRLPVVQRRLAQGGVRLAAILNNIFSPQASYNDAHYEY